MTGLEQRVLQNGLRVSVRRDPGLPLVAVNLWVGVGSSHESEGRTGLAHLFEHILFQGSQHVGPNEHFAHLQKVGGVANGSTWYDRTNYYETVPAQHLDLALWLESDRMGFLLPALTPEKLEVQRGVVLNERRQRVDNQPYGRALEVLHESMMPSGHPYRWPVLGSIEDIRAATLEDVSEFFRRHYTPANMVLSLVGDLPDHTWDSVERYFGDLDGPGPPPRPQASRETCPPVTVVLRDDVPLARVYLGARTPAFDGNDWLAGQAFALAAAGGRSSPLYRDLVHDRELAEDVSLYAYPTALESVFLCVATATPGTDPSTLDEALREHLGAPERAADVDEFDRALRRLDFLDASERSSLDRIADRTSEGWTLFGDPERISSRRERRRALAPDDLQSFARTYLSPARLHAVHVVPRGGSPA